MAALVDVDLKQFFDEVDHDALMARLGRKVKDKRLKRLINSYLKAGVMCEGAGHPTDNLLRLLDSRQEK